MPQVPEPRPEDPEDVSWALSTAEAMWARGDHSEGVKWVRRAAEAASDAENDERSLELAKAAADLAGLVSKRVSRASIHIDDDELMADDPPPPPKPPTQKPPPPKASPKPPSSVTKQISTPSRPPAPLPSKTSQPPPAMGGGRPAAKPLGTNTKSIPPPKMGPPKSDPRRKSKAGLESEARAAFGAPDTSPEPLDSNHDSDTSESPVIDAPMMRRSRPELGSNDPTFVGNVAELMKKKAAAAASNAADEEEDRTAEEWDASPTQNLTGDEMGFPNFPIPNMPPGGDPRKTVAALPQTDLKSTMMHIQRPGGPNKAPPPASSGASSARSAELHDPGIVTTQAVRVVVWRDANGVHVAPAGTVVSAITVDAVLVALDANADLTAWLTQKGR